MMVPDIVSAFNRAHFDNKAPADFSIWNARRNAKGPIMAVRYQTATAEMALPNCDIIIITVVRTVDKGVIDVKDNATLERVMIHSVPFVRYKAKGTGGWQKMREEFDLGSVGIAITTPVHWLASPGTMRKRWQNGEITISWVVFVIQRCKVAQRLIKEGIMVTGEW